MRILYIDIDSQRPDHFGCYGYHRATSPNIDRIAAEGVRFENVYVSDAPCLPSRMALWTGRCGFRNGCVNHGGAAADLFPEGHRRGFRAQIAFTGWMKLLRDLGYYCATVSSFGERHSAFHWMAGWNEILNCGKGGQERADEVAPLAVDWIERNARRGKWFLHVNFWDPHTPYNTPESYGEPFTNAPLSAFYNEEMRQRCWQSFGPHSAQEPAHFDTSDIYGTWPRMPRQIDSMASMKKWIDGYDTGIRYMDDHLAHVFNALADAGVLDETVIVIGADHGENLGELNVWGDHQTADQITCRVPLIIRWPGGEILGGRVDRALHYHFDWAATLVELLGGKVPENWDGRSFSDAFRGGREDEREFLVLSQGAWAVQRAVRFENYLCLRSYHDGYKDLPPVALWDVTTDPHEEHDLAGEQPRVVDRAMALLVDWQHDMMLRSETNIDPLMTVLREGGPFHCRGYLKDYLARLRETGRSKAAARLQERHPTEF